MSIPPTQPPPGGYYGAPPPQPASSGGGIWKALGIGCAAVFLLVLIAGFFAVRSFKTQLDHPSKNSVFGIGITVGKAVVGGIVIQQAVVRYHQQNGHYPASLLTLVQAGGLDGKVLHNDLDDSPDPGHVSWRYAKPDEGAPGDTPILEEPYHTTIGGGSQPGRIVITLDGRNQTQTNPSAPPPQS